MKRDGLVSRNCSWSFKANIPQILMGIAGLCLGELVYLFGRSPESYGFGLIVKNHLGFIVPQKPLFGVLVGNLPSFTHVFAFSLMTAGLLGLRRKGTLLICLIWFSIDALFETGQALKPVSLAIIPEWIKVHPLPMANLQEYFRYGTFDIRDIVACLLGALAALLVAEIMRAPYRKE